MGIVVDAQVARQRNELIARLGLLDRIGDATFGGLVRLAAHVTGAASAAIHIVDAEYQHRIAAVNAPLGRHPRGDAMCPDVVARDEPAVCTDATEDPRFAYSSFVHGDQPVRFYASVPLHTTDGTAVGTICAFDTVARELDDAQRRALEDLARPAVAHVELARLAIDLAHASSRDALTGVLNRLALVDRVEHAMARRARYGGSLLVVVADVDAFKAVNDHAGHAVGDAALVAVAQRLSRASRAADSVARLGGDEFVVVAEVSRSEDAAAIVRRLRDALDRPVDVAGLPGGVRVTIGVALCQDGDDVTSLLTRADADLIGRKARLRGTAGPALR